MTAPSRSGLFERAQAVIPGGVDSPVRSFASVGGDPFFVERAEGPYLFDTDGNRYVDYVQSWGASILGHAHPAVVEAVQRAAAAGTSYGAPTEREVELAEVIAARVPSVDKVRLVSSGTEAGMTAVRLARGVTGRPKILKFAGCYHGHVDALLVAAGSGVATLGLPGSAGVTEGTVADTVVVPYNDDAALDAAFDRYGAELAAVIVEPVAANMGLVPPIDGFLTRLRDRCTAAGALLICDEVITGFRLGPAGAQGRYGITPDLSMFGKVAGGGLPLAAVGGTRRGHGPPRPPRPRLPSRHPERQPPRHRRRPRRAERAHRRQLQDPRDQSNDASPKACRRPSPTPRSRESEP